MRPIMEETGLIKPTTITNMVNGWKQAEQKIRYAHRLLHEADTLLRDEFCGPGRYVHVKYDELHRDTLDDLLTDLKKNGWECIIERTNLRKVMSHRRQQEIDDQLKNPKALPEITEPNILAMLETTYNSMALFAEEMVREVYDWLRPGGYTLAQYKTNQKSEVAGVGEKIIKTWAVERGYNSEHPWRIRYNSQESYTALDNVFSLLDGKGVAKTHYGPTYDAVANCGRDGICETEYFRLKCYHNGNLHIQFKRLDLLAEFNRVAGGARIRNGPACPQPQPEPEPVRESLVLA